MTFGRPRVAVTGLGMVTGLGCDVASTFQCLMAGESAIRALDAVVHQCRTAPMAAAVMTSDVGRESLTESQGVEDSRSDRLAELAAREAIWQAGLGGSRIDLILGASSGATREGIAECEARGDQSVLPLVARLVSQPIGASGHRLAAALGTVRRSTVVCSACSSGALAIAIGAMRLEQGYDLPQVVGGTDSLNLLTLSGFESLGAMSPVACRPFDEQRRGLTLGEGAGFLVLETATMANRRGARVLVWLDGYAIGAEAHHLVHPEPDGHRAAALIREALVRARISAGDVGYVNAHGTATIANDEMECRALRQALGPAIEAVHVSSSKGQIGHTLAAAGAIEAVIAARAILEQAVPPTGGLSQPAGTCQLRHVPNVGIRTHLRAVLSSSFGFGGACAVLAMQRQDQSGGLDLPEESVQPIEILGSPEDATIYVTGLVTLGTAGIRRGRENAAWFGDSNGYTHSELPFEPLDLLVMERSRRFDRLTALTTLGCSYALSSARLDGATGVDGDRIGLVLGNALGPVGRSVKFIQRILKRGAKGANPGEFPHLLPSSVSGNASIYASLRGPVFNVSDMGATMQSALELGINCIQSHLARAMLVGTTETSDDVIVRAQQEGAKLGFFPVNANDGSAWLVIESHSSAVGRGATGCELATAGWFSELSDPQRRLPNPQADSVVLWANRQGREENEILEPLGWAGVARRFCLAQTYDGWSHPGFVLAAGAGLVLAGECPSTLTVTCSPRGLHYAVFRRSPLLGLATQDG